MFEGGDDSIFDLAQILKIDTIGVRTWEAATNRVDINRFRSKKKPSIMLCLPFFTQYNYALLSNPFLRFYKDRHIAWLMYGETLKTNKGMCLITGLEILFCTMLSFKPLVNISLTAVLQYK